MGEGIAHFHKPISCVLLENTMTQDRITEDYRGFKLLSAFNNGKHRGRAWFGKDIVRDIEGDSIASVMEQLKSWVDDGHAQRISSLSPTPSATVFIDAFERIRENINDGQLAMLRAHYSAPNRCLSPKALADAAGYQDIGGVNLWYGFLGQWVFEAMSAPMSLLIEDGKPVYTSALASYIQDPAYAEVKNVWKMHDDVAIAIKAIALVK
jgi:hypothetical protein